MRRFTLVTVVTLCVILIGSSDSWARGGRGGGGRVGGGGGARMGGGVSRGGGGYRPSGGMSRPSGGMSRPSMGSAPSYSRPPSYGGGRPGGVSRPSAPQVSSRPSNISRPGGPIPGSSRPNVGTRPSIGTRPSVGTLPSQGARPGSSRGPTVITPGGGRPSVSPGGDRPSIGGQPGIGGPGGGNLPGLAGRPGSSTRPGSGLGTAAGIGAAAGLGAAAGVGLSDRVGSGERPSTLPAGRPGADGRPATLPGLADRAGVGGGPGNRTADRGARHDDLQSRLENRDFRSDRLDNVGDRQDIRTDRQDNRQENWGDRQDNRQDVREDWSDQRQDRREDWQNWADNHDWVYHDWHHGYWHGYADGWWDHLWDEHPVAGALGVTAWGLNRAAYGFGLWGYYNPYYVEPYAVGTSYIDYSQPLIVSEPYAVEVPVQPTDATDAIASSGSEPLPPGVTQAGLDAFNQARTAFYSRDYSTALKEIDQAAVEMPQDATVHEFRGLVLFALGRYQEAAAPVHAVLAVGPGWDWTTMVGLYPSVDPYTVQLRALEKYVRENSDDASSRFLLAYHYITTRNTEAAITRLREVTRLRPDDTVAAELLTMLAGPQTESGTATPAPAATDSGAAAVPAEDLTGKWIASGPKESEYQVSFAADGTFNWSYASNGKTEQIGGVYAVDGDVLALEPDSGGTLPARVSKPRPDILKFEPAGAPTSDSTLMFRKSAS